MILSDLDRYGRTPGDFASAFLIILGGVLLFLFLQYWRGRVKTPHWLSFWLTFISPIIPIIATIVALIIARTR